MNEQMLAVTVALGWTLQWAKAPKKFPTWAAYAVFAGFAIVAFIWATPGIEQVTATSWRQAVEMFIGFLLGIEGVSAATRKARLAPKTDSL